MSTIKQFLDFQNRFMVNDSTIDITKACQSNSYCGSNYPNKTLCDNCTPIMTILQNMYTTSIQPTIQSTVNQYNELYQSYQSQISSLLTSIQELDTKISKANQTIHAYNEKLQATNQLFLQNKREMEHVLQENDTFSVNLVNRVTFGVPRLPPFFTVKRSSWIVFLFLLDLFLIIGVFLEMYYFR